VPARLTTVALVLLALCGCSSHESGPTAPSRAPVSKASSAEARSAAAALRNLSTNPTSLEASSVRSRVAGRENQAVPRGAIVVPNEKSWMPDGHGGGVMTVTVSRPGTIPINYAAVLVRDHGAWKVLATVPVSSDSNTGTG
jgi:hypothetical protein